LCLLKQKTGPLLALPVTEKPGPVSIAVWRYAYNDKSALQSYFCDKFSITDFQNKVKHDHGAT
jgi:hypothetical protein